MAENKEEQLTDEELAQLQLAEENENAVDRLVKELGCPRAASASLPPACCTCLPSAIRSASCPACPR
ncbi:MAG: hypothetical protein ACLU1W_07395 [Collinsella sp.]